MKKYASIIAVIAAPFFFVNVLFGCHIPPNPPSCPSCPPGSTLVDIDFDDFYAGTLVGAKTTNSQYDNLQRYTSTVNPNLAEGLGFTISVGNQPGECGIDVASLYDTDRRLYYDKYNKQTTSYNKVVKRDDNWVGRAGSGNDPDLEITNYGSYPNEYSRWSGGGNMANYNLGNALILQQGTDCDDISQGHLDLVQGRTKDSQTYAPNDFSSGGFIEFTFETAMNGFGFTFADLDDDETTRSNITFFDTSGNSVAVSFDQFSTGLLSDRGALNQSGKVDWGDSSANRIDTLTVTELNTVMNSSLNNIGKVQFNLLRSGGITHINYCYQYSPVPEASTLVAGGMMIFFLGGLQIMRKRRNKRD